MRWDTIPPCLRYIPCPEDPVVRKPKVGHSYDSNIFDPVVDSVRLADTTTVDMGSKAGHVNSGVIAFVQHCPSGFGMGSLF